MSWYRVRVREDPLLLWLATDPWYDFRVIIYRQNNCTSGFRNVTANDIMYSYVLG